MEQLLINVPDLGELQTALRLGDLRVIDVVLVLGTAIFVILGLYRGLWWQIVRFVGAGFTMLAISTWNESLAGWLTAQWPELSQRAAWAISILLLILGGLILIWMVGKIGTGAIKAAQLGLVNRAAGGILGAATALSIHTALVVVVCQLAPEPLLAQYVSGSWSENLVHVLADRNRTVIEASPPNNNGALIRDEVAPGEEVDPEWLPDSREEQPNIETPRNPKVQ